MSYKKLFVPFSGQEPSLKKRRNLPHWEHSEATYFVTFRTADSVPTAQRRVWEAEKLAWLRRHPQPWSKETRILYHRVFEGRLQRWLDQNHGACPFRSRQNSGIVVESLRSFDTVRYVLDEFAILPNHVHVIVKPVAGHQLPGILHSWKSFSALRINRRSGRTGRLWMDESFDHIVRSWRSLERYRSYIAQNPAKARLREGEFILGRGEGLVQWEE